MHETEVLNHLKPCVNSKTTKLKKIELLLNGMKRTLAKQCSKWTLQCIYVDSDRKHGTSTLKLLIANSSTSTTKK